MIEANAHEIRFQCPRCGQELKQTIGRLKANEHMTCCGCGVGININTNRLAKATAMDKIPRRFRSSFSLAALLQYAAA